MQKTNLLLLLLSLLIFSCSSGNKALQKGNYFQAITKAVERLKGSPNNSKASQVLKEGYPLVLQWSQEEIDQALSSDQAFKWEQTLNVMHDVNRLSDLIRSTPAARKIIPQPKYFGDELNVAYQRAAEERYTAGMEYFKRGTREDARTAYRHFEQANAFIPGYEDVLEKLAISKELGTVKVVVEAVTVNAKNYKLSSEFFYDQVFEYLNNKFPEQSLVNFYSPQQAEKVELELPDYLVRMEFFDFSVGNLIRNEKEENVTRTVKEPLTDTTFVRKTYRAKLKTYTDEVVSSGRLQYRVIDFPDDKLMRDKLIPGTFTWVNQYGIFVGDAKALSDQQLAITQNKAMPLPPGQDLFIEFTRPIYQQLTGELFSFFRQYQ